MTVTDSFDGTGFPKARTHAHALMARAGWRIIAGVGGGAVLLAAAAFYFIRPPAIDVVHPRIGPAIVAVYASGTVEATVMLPVAPRVGGRLVKLESDERTMVKKGQVVARLESADLASNIAQLASQAEFARDDFSRYERLMRQNAVAPQAYERARATWRSAEAALRQARAQAAYMTLTAPDDCQVISRDGEVGQYIAANTPLFWLSCHSALRISAQVDEEDIPLVQPGQDVLIRADAFAGRVFHGTVTEVTPKGDPVGRSYRVRIALPPDSPLRIGMTTETNIIVSKRDNALLLPAGAVADGAVWKILDGRAVRAPVKEGVRSGEWIEIVKGVSRSDLVAKDGRTKPPRRRLRPVLP